MPLDPQLKDMLDFIASAGYPPMEEGTPALARQGMRAMSVDMVKPEDVVPVGSVEDLTVPGGAGERDARLYRPEGDGPVADAGLPARRRLRRRRPRHPRPDVPPHLPRRRRGPC